MFEWIEFENFKALRKARLPLSRFTLLVGANGSGKSTALAGIMALRTPEAIRHREKRSAGINEDKRMRLEAGWVDQERKGKFEVRWEPAGYTTGFKAWDSSKAGWEDQILHALKNTRLFSLDADSIAQPVRLEPNLELAPNGAKLAGVLDRLRDQHPEQFEALNARLSEWMPEFDRILFETPGEGHRAIALRTRDGRHSIPAGDLSQGTLIALALLTLAYLPSPPSIVCLEEPDRGLHPRLLRDVRDALYRLAHPDPLIEKRQPVQVIATTHNPYFLDLFREHPEEIVIAEKTGLEASFSRLSDREDLDEILGDASLSEVWYSGVLGGVPVGT